MVHGSVVHFEIPADNVERAQKFYTKAFGWTAQTMPEMNYTMVGTGPADAEGMPSEPGYIGGGIAKRGDVVHAPVITILVDDIDAALKSVAQHGGSTVQKKEPIGPMGFVAYFKDSEGNIVGLFQAPAE
ncbi:MAG: VOC family protein [Thermoplasmata archaeon]|nr:VOC family protein [Thermoplasmata archaeon]